VLLSNRERFLFVHVPKTAGTALTRALEPFADSRPREGLRKFLSRLPAPESELKAAFRMHVTARWARVKLPRPVFEDYCKFSVVRNPFDRAVSHYHWQSQYPDQRNYSRTQEMSFRDYLRDFKRRQLWHDERQVRYLCDRKGKLLIDRVLRFETLADDFSALMAELGIQASLARHKTSQHEPYPTYYDEETKALAVEIFARDFETFGYSTELPSVEGGPGPVEAIKSPHRRVA
jgi:hypothetical protein